MEIGHYRRYLSLTHLTLAFCLLFSLLLAGCDGNPPTSTPTPNPAQEAAKIDTILRDLLVAYQAGGIQAARDYARNTGLLDDADRVRFSLTLSSSAAAAPIAAQIKKMGGEVYSSADERLGVVVELTRLTGYVSSADKRNFFQELAAFKEVKELKFLLRPPLADFRTTISLNEVSKAAIKEEGIKNEGIKIIGADRWQNAGFSGRGIKVGIIDGGFAGYRNYLGTALPSASQVQFKSFLLGNGEGSELHGVAVAEIVHSIAPDAALLLTPIEDEIGFTNAVRYLIEQKVQILQISLGWGGIFPGDGTGKMDEILDEARSRGILPIVSAGNYGEAHYLKTFTPDPDGFHQFGPGRTTLKLTAEAVSSWVALRWEERWDAPLSNLDLYILDSKMQPLVSSRNEQGAGKSPKPPSELAPFRPTPGQVYYIQVKQNGPVATPNLRFHLFAYNSRLEEATAEGSLATPGDARRALSVGATAWKDDKVEGYSSRGPTQDKRNKPELMAPSGVGSQVFKQPFAGTSAAAPQVSGAAALVWSADRERLTADQVALYLCRNAFSLGEPGRNPITGCGRAQLGPEENARNGAVDLLGATPAGPAFEDTFRNAASGLPNNGLGYYDADGQPSGYLVPGPAGQINWNTYLNRSFEEFRAEVTVTPGASRANFYYGLVFWQQAGDDYYSWLIAGNRYGLFKRSGSNWLTLVEWSQDAALNATSSSNLRLSLEATTDYIRLRANNNLLQSIFLRPGSKTPPPARLGGRFGFAAGQSGPTQAVTITLPSIKFTNLLITPLTSR